MRNKQQHHDSVATVPMPAGRRKTTVFWSVLLLALFNTLVIEMFNHKVFTTGFASLWRFITKFPLALLVNYLVILTTLTLVVFVRRRIFWSIMISIIWVVCGGVNGFILINRMTPFTSADLTVLNTGLATLPNYLSTGYIILLAVVLVVVIALLVWLWIKGRKNDEKLSARLLKGVAALIVSLALTVGAGLGAFHVDQLSTSFANLAFAYDDYGFAYCFLQTWLNKGIKRPPGYSHADMLRIKEEIDHNRGEAELPKAKTDVNVIFVQLESFMDPSVITDLQTNEDPIPNWHALEEQFTSGPFKVPVVGAGTANTEFEVLTGMNSRYFGPGEYPYKTCLQDRNIESVAYDLAKVGYGTHAIHNHRATFYTRHIVYANLGFDDFTSLEYMPLIQKTEKGGWAKDYVLTDQIRQALNSTEDQADLVFTVSVQGHGKYPTEPILEEPEITVENCPENVNEYAMEYYLNQVHEMDDFVGKLTDMLARRPEKTILVLYGDHLPALNLEAADLSTHTLYETEYIMWDNFGLEKEDAEITSYQAAARAMEKIGITEGYMTGYHQFCSEESGYETDLKKLQYDALYGGASLYDGEVPFETSDMRMGILDMEITAIIPKYDDWYIVGSNFTPYCHITVGDKEFDTDFISPKMLKIHKDPETEDCSDLGILVMDKHKEVLSDTELD